MSRGSNRSVDLVLAILLALLAPHPSPAAPGTASGDAESACVPPGLTVAEDPAGDTNSAVDPTGDPSLDLRRIELAEPFVAPGAEMLVLTLTVEDLSAPHPSAVWRVLWTDPAPSTTQRFVSLENCDPSVGLECGYGTFDGSIFTLEGTPEDCEVDAAGTLQITVDKGLVGLDDSIHGGALLTGIEARSQVFFGAACTGLVGTADTAGPDQPYEVVTNALCDAGCEPQPGIFFDDFEPQAEPGWTVDTAIDLNPTSQDWTVILDPFAQSPTRSFASDAQGLDLKDDRLVAPPQTATLTTSLVFWHRFGSESGFDGGVLEVSTDGGATFDDVLDAGGLFVEGAYNGAISPDFGSPIAGRDAWTGASPVPNAMSRVEVDLGALAGSDALLRFRLALDPLALGSLPGQGWWIDDVELRDVLVVPPSCPRPPVAEDDEATTPEGTPVTIEVLANDFDPDGDPLTLDSVTDPPNGSAAANPDGTATYTPDPGFVGVDAFLYSVCDPGPLCDEGGVTIVVEPRPGPLTVTGGGWIPEPGGAKANFGFEARTDGTTASGRLRYRSRADGVELRATAIEIKELVIGVEVRGSCTIGRRPCTFVLTVDDAGEPGRGRDRFMLEVLDPAGDPLHGADAVLGGGNIQVHR